MYLGKTNTKFGISMLILPRKIINKNYKNSCEPKITKKAQIGLEFQTFRKPLKITG